MLFLLAYIPNKTMKTNFKFTMLIFIKEFLKIEHFVLLKITCQSQKGTPFWRVVHVVLFELFLSVKVDVKFNYLEERIHLRN